MEDLGGVDSAFFFFLLAWSVEVLIYVLQANEVTNCTKQRWLDDISTGRR
jgi:hypothetical protein